MPNCPVCYESSLLCSQCANRARGLYHPILPFWDFTRADEPDDYIMAQEVDRLAQEDVMLADTFALTIVEEEN